MRAIQTIARLTATAVRVTSSLSSFIKVLAFAGRLLISLYTRCNIWLRFALVADSLVDPELLSRFEDLFALRLTRKHTRFAVMCLMWPVWSHIRESLRYTSPDFRHILSAHLLPSSCYIWHTRSYSDCLAHFDSRNSPGEGAKANEKST